MEEQGASCSNFEENHTGADKYDNLPIEQIKLKIRTYITLCKTNKINTNNAFDIEMIGCFFSWLKRNKEAISRDDLELFQEISDNLEVCSKIYSYRVDNASESTSKLVEEFRMINNYRMDLSKRDISPKDHTYRRSRSMLTTNDKLNFKSIDRSNERPAFMRNVRDFDLRKLLREPKSHRPSDYLIALYNNSTVQDELDNNKKLAAEKNNPEECSEFDLSDLREHISKNIMHPDIEKMRAEYDNIPSVEKEPEDVGNKSNISNTSDLNSTKFDLKSTKFDYLFEAGGSTPKVEEQSTFADLVQCVDGVDRPYSFFNPKLFANFKGPRAWKTQTMIKSLLSSSEEERNEVMALPVIANDLEMKTILESRTGGNRFKKQNDEVKINWYDTDDLEEKLETDKDRKKSIVSTSRWNPVEYVNKEYDPKTMVHQIKFQSIFLKSHTVIQDMYSFQENVTNLKVDCESTDEIEEEEEEEMMVSTTEYQPEDPDIQNLSAIDRLILKRNSEAYSSDDMQSSPKHDYFPIEFKPEAKMDMFELKKKISKIIDEECIETDSDTGFSSQITFKTLLLKLLAEDKEISFHVVFVALLHVTNERGLKLVQTPDDMDCIKISKPITKPL